MLSTGLHLTSESTHRKAIAASIAALSLDTPLAKDAMRLTRALLIQASSSLRALRRMMPWN